jgi:hypothetical protein
VLLAGDRFFVGVVQLVIVESLVAGGLLLFPSVDFRFRLVFVAGRVSIN